MKEAGLAFSTALASAVNFVLLVKLFRKKVPQFSLTNVVRASRKIFLSSCIMGLVVMAVWTTLAWLLPFDSLMFRIIKVFVPVMAGLATYLISCTMLDVLEIKELMHSFGGQRGAKKGGFPVNRYE